FEPVLDDLADNTEIDFRKLVPGADIGPHSPLSRPRILRASLSFGDFALERRSLSMTVKLILPLGGALLGLMFSAPAGAQTLRVPRVEVGGEFGILDAIGPGLYLRPTAGPRL